ncbi:MAG: hypothetical protein EZS28_033615 [Streblomastix strix]|uniref:Uncharacterized protein n=1 Tax=Streblomastix strix TaxID=222440 RepID=A0A5J4UK34_9EUKA|nr:MAG: hypothetical protein EZS28_033615 [Streblomastix strix]
MIRNGQANEWKVIQTVEKSKKNPCVAKADTYIFFEDDEDQPQKTLQKDKKNKQTQHSINKNNPYQLERNGEVAGPGLSEIHNHGRIQIPEYIPSVQSIRKSRQVIQIDDERTLSTKSKAENRIGHFACTTAIALIVQQVGVNGIQFLFDFEHHCISMHSIIIVAHPPSSSRIMPVIDDLIIFTNKSSNTNSSLTVNKPIPNFHPFLTIAIIIKSNGQIQYHKYQFKWFIELVMMNIAYWTQLKQSINSLFLISASNFFIQFKLI